MDFGDLLPFLLTWVILLKLEDLFSWLRRRWFMKSGVVLTELDSFFSRRFIQVVGEQLEVKSEE